MATLAKYLARLHGNIEIGTDDRNKFLFPYVRQRRQNIFDKQVYLNMAMQNILPMPNENIPIHDIIDFRNQHERQLRCFRRRIDEFQWSLSMCRSVEEIQGRVDMLRREIDDDIAEIEELMRSRSIAKGKTMLRTLIPIGVEAGIEFLGLRGSLSSMQVIAASAALEITASIFCTDREPLMPENRAYLFYAYKNGIIIPSNRVHAPNAGE